AHSFGVEADDLKRAEARCAVRRLRVDQIGRLEIVPAVRQGGSIAKRRRDGWIVRRRTRGVIGLLRIPQKERSLEDNCGTALRVEALASALHVVDRLQGGQFDSEICGQRERVVLGRRTGLARSKLRRRRPYPPLDRLVQLRSELVIDGI